MLEQAIVPWSNDEEEQPTTSKRRATSLEDRKRVVAAYERGQTVPNICEMFGLNRFTVYSILRKVRLTGVVEARKRGGTKPKKLSNDVIDSIKRWIDQDCTISLRKMQQKLEQEHNIQASITTITRAIEGFHYSFKRVNRHPERRNAPSNIEERRKYAVEFMSLPREYSERNIIYIDEVGMNVSMRATMGRSAVGKPAVVVVPQLRSRNISIVCAMTRHGIVHYVAKTTAIERGSFKDFILQLKGKLEEVGIFEPVLVMDNVAFHKCNEVKECITQHINARLLYLPPYSPFLNPIENMFSKWKNIVRRANPENENDLMTAIENGASLITFQDCEGYVRNMWEYINRSLSGEQILD